MSVPVPDTRFAADWLALREPVDHRSRAHELVPILTDAWLGGSWRTVVDLGAGTGSNGRYLAPRLPSGQRWILVDHDERLLEATRLPAEAGTPERRVGGLEDEGLEALEEADVVAGAALLDLVGRAWLERLAETCVRRGSGALFTTIYDGSVAWRSSGEDPALREGDALVAEAVNRHQRRDKGLGAALGPDAALVAREIFTARGYRTWLAPAPWVLGPEDAPLARALIDGWSAAAREQEPDARAMVERWLRARRKTVDSSDFRLTVGHLDLLALPPEEPPQPAGR